MIPPGGGIRPLSTRRTCPARRHAEVRAAFIDNDHMVHIQCGQDLANGGPRRLIPLDGAERFF